MKPKNLVTKQKNKNVHYVYHNFESKFKNFDGKWKYIGYDLMVQVAKWAKKFPEDVKIVVCDDSYFAGSDLICIEHRSTHEYMGISVVFIPQCTGEQPTTFFLYPGHRRNFYRTLRSMGKKRENPL